MEDYVIAGVLLVIFVLAIFKPRSISKAVAAVAEEVRSSDPRKS